jgi:hypothetical protein
VTDGETSIQSGGGMVDAKLKRGYGFESRCVYLDEKHIASMAEHSLINHYRFDSCPDNKNK